MIVTYTAVACVCMCLCVCLCVSVCVTVANVAYQKESFVSSRRSQHKRHSGATRRTTRWVHGHASRAVDGRTDHSIHSCTILDNFYVDKPVWMVDLRRKTTVSGVIIVTWRQRDGDLHDGITTVHLTTKRSYHAYSVFVTLITPSPNLASFLRISRNFAQLQMSDLTAKMHFRPRLISDRTALHKPVD